MEEPRRRQFTPPGGGAVGFGCGFLLTFAIVIAIFWLPTSGQELAIVLLIAAVGGLLAAKFGDDFFERVTSALRWW